MYKHELFKKENKYDHNNLISQAASFESFAGKK